MRSPLTAEQYSRIVNAVQEENPRLARELTEMVAEGRTPEWLTEFAQRNPNVEATDALGSSMIYQALERQSANLKGLLDKAGFDAIDTGRDVQKLTGAGIRHKDAKFDPDKADDWNIYASYAGPGYVFKSDDGRPVY